MKQLLLISLLAEDNTDILPKLSELIHQHQCMILHTRAITLGNHVLLFGSVDGPWNEIIKLEQVLPSFAAHYHCLLFHHRSDLPEEAHQAYPYHVEVYSPIEAAIMPALLQFFWENNIKIYELNSQPFYANPLGIAMFMVEMRILIPQDLAISVIRENFNTLCDALNIDAYLEPEHN